MTFLYGAGITQFKGRDLITRRLVVTPDNVTIVT